MGTARHSTQAFHIALGVDSAGRHALGIHNVFRGFAVYAVCEASGSHTNDLVYVSQGAPGALL